METAESTPPIRIESARRYVNGRRQRWGVVLLYPDKLASVNVRSELWGCFFGPVIMVAASWPVTRSLAEIAGALADHGREVRATPLGLAVIPQAVGNGA